MVATDGQEEADKVRKKRNVIYGRNVLSAQTLEVSSRKRNGDPSRKGCVVTGQTTKANNN